MRIEAFLKDIAAERGGELAVISGRAQHTFAALDIKAARLAAALQQRGIARGGRVALYVHDAWSSVVSIFAVYKAGGVVCPVDPDTAPDDLTQAMKAIRPRAVITEARLASAAAQALMYITSVRLVVLALGDRTQATDTCLSLEEIVNRIGAHPVLAEPGEAADAAFVPPGAPPLTHTDVVGAAEPLAAGGGGVPMPRLTDGLAMAQLLAAIRSGTPIVAETGLALSSRSAGSERPARAVAR